jgi:hypothetical protein
VTKNLRDLLLHVALGFGYALLILGVGLLVWVGWLPSMVAFAGLAVFSPTLLSYARESEQARAKRKLLNEQTGKRIRPGDVRYWSGHRTAECLAVTAGALLALLVLAL